MGFPCGQGGKECTCNVGDLGSIPGLGRSPGGGKGYPLQYSGLEKSMDCIVLGVTKSQTRLSDFHFTSHLKNKREWRQIIKGTALVTDAQSFSGISATGRGSAGVLPVRLQSSKGCIHLVAMEHW